MIAFEIAKVSWELEVEVEYRMLHRVPSFMVPPWMIQNAGDIQANLFDLQKFSRRRDKRDIRCPFPLL